jgi:hypothetical protein
LIPTFLSLESTFLGRGCSGCSKDPPGLTHPPSLPDPSVEYRITRRGVYCGVLHAVARTCGVLHPDNRQPPTTQQQHDFCLPAHIPLLACSRPLQRVRGRGFVCAAGGGNQTGRRANFFLQSSSSKSSGGSESSTSSESCSDRAAGKDQPPAKPEEDRTQQEAQRGAKAKALSSSGSRSSRGISTRSGATCSRGKRHVDSCSCKYSSSFSPESGHSSNLNSHSWNTSPHAAPAAHADTSEEATAGFPAITAAQRRHSTA